MNCKNVTRSRIGYYLEAGKPPAEDADNSCVVCGELWTPDTARTFSVMWEGDRAISLFYRTHRACADALTEDDGNAISRCVLTIGDQIALEHGRISGPAAGNA